MDISFDRGFVFFPGIPVFPRKTSGNKSIVVRPLLVLPWEWITVYGKEFKDNTEESGIAKAPLCDVMSANSSV